jgi:hypothetical protein
MTLPAGIGNREVHPPQNVVLPPVGRGLRGWQMAAFQLAAWAVMPIGMLIEQIVIRTEVGPGEDAESRPFVIV